MRPAFVERELDRVSVHLSGLVSLLAAHGVRARRALDVGCSTGGSTASLALSEAIGADQVIGVDPNRLSIDAARVRSRGLGLADKVRYVHIDANAALPFRDRSFDLVLAVSVLEFVPTVSGRERLLAELQRLVRPGGHVYVSTPSRWQLRELHSGRWLGNHRRRSDKPWASGTRFILRQMTECRQIPVVDWLVLRATSRLEPAGRWPPLRTLGGWSVAWRHGRSICSGGVTTPNVTDDEPEDLAQRRARARLGCGRRLHRRDPQLRALEGR